MPTPHTPLDAPGFDPEALRERYRAERDRRIRPEGRGQYQSFAGRFGYYDEDPYAEGEFSREPLRDRVEVLIVGGGFGGLLARARLRQAGVESIRVVEKGADFGGTWYWNRYPGIHCDIESYIYLPLLEEVGYVPRWKYAPGEEIRQHARAIGRTFELYRDACFRTQVTALRWDEDADEWLVTMDRGDRVRARYVITASGTLSEAKLPGIPGIETFAGHYTVVSDEVKVPNGITCVGDRLFVNEMRMGGRLLELFPDGGEPRVLTEGLALGNAMQLGPDGHLYYPHMVTGEVWRIPPDGGTPERVAHGVHEPVAVRFDRGGVLLVLSRGEAGLVTRIDLHGDGSRTVIASGLTGLDNAAFDAENRMYVSSFATGAPGVAPRRDERRHLGARRHPARLALGGEMFRRR